MTARVRFPHEYVALDPAVRREIVDCFAADGLSIGAGILYRPPAKDPEVAILAMHPRADFFRHYLVPRLVGAGYAFLGSPTRNLNNDADALHERLLLDVAGNVAWLRERGFRRVVLLGNSGGGSLFAFYLAQAGKPPADRLRHAPSGGSIFSYGRDPISGNYGEGLGRVMSARGWLSTWSGLSSNAALEQTLPDVRVPTLVIAARADTDIHPSECRRALAASAARDKQYAELEGADHYLRAAGAEGARLADPKDRVAEEFILPWLRERWPA